MIFAGIALRLEKVDPNVQVSIAPSLPSVATQRRVSMPFYSVLNNKNRLCITFWNSIDRKKGLAFQNYDN